MPIINSANTLKNLTVRYNEYTVRLDYPSVDEESYEKCKATTALLQSSIKHVREAKTKLEGLYNEIREEYRNCKNKSDKKDVMLEIEQTENDSQLHKEIASADELIFMLSARYDESKCTRDTMSVKLGYISQQSLILQKASSENIEQPNDEEEDTNQTGQNHSSGSNPSPTAPTSSVFQRNDDNGRHFRSIKPPQAKLPNFFGNAEDFPEYWAIFETLVHNSRELDVMEKILLLKESLSGKAQASIKGIKLVPENYEWIIQTLQENYCNQPINRSQVVQKLVNLKPASKFSDSCSAVFDQIQILVNQMVSAGYDVRKTCDPMWCETILAKFPRDVVKPVLLSNHSQDSQTIGDLISQLKKEITAKGYVENRLGHKQTDTANTSGGQKYANYATQRTPSGDQRNTASLSHSGNQCLFCHNGNHGSMTCRSVTDQGIRRKILTDGHRCWKCCSSNHSSFECNKPDFSKCGQKHHVSLCFKREGGQPATHAPPTNNQRNRTGQNNQRPARFQREQRNFPTEQSRWNANNLQMCSKNNEPKSKNTSTSSQLVLMTAEGNVWNHNREEYEKILFFFDTGAQKTVIEESLADHLGAPKQTTELCTMSGIGGHTETFKSHIVNLQVSTVYGEELELEIQTKPIITNGFPGVNLSPIDVAFLKTNGICLANSKVRGEHQKPHILVGLDHYHDLVTGPINAIKTPTGLRIAKTVFGPTIYGKGSVPGENSSNLSYGMTAVCEFDEKEILQKMFELEGLGISKDEYQSDEKVYRYLEQYSKEISLEGGHITAPFPLKDNITELEDNYLIAIRRPESLQMTLRNNEEQRRWYCKIINKYQQEGMIEAFRSSEEDAKGEYYMPHSGVWKPSKNVPLRIVFDASSKRKGKLSLNDVTHEGEAFVIKYTTFCSHRGTTK